MVLADWLGMGDVERERLAAGEYCIPTVVRRTAGLVQ